MYRENESAPFVHERFTFLLHCSLYCERICAPVILLKQNIPLSFLVLTIIP